MTSTIDSASKKKEVFSTYETCPQTMRTKGELFMRTDTVIIIRFLFVIILLVFAIAIIALQTKSLTRDYLENEIELQLMMEENMKSLAIAQNDSKELEKKLENYIATITAIEDNIEEIVGQRIVFSEED